MKVENILITSMCCALAGGVASAITQIAKQELEKKQMKIGYDWKHLKTDGELTDMVIHLRDFEKYNRAKFFQIGSKIDEIIMIWNMANTSGTPKNIVWNYKLFEYKNDVMRNMDALLESIKEKTNNPMIAATHGISKGRGKLLIEEFETLKEQIGAALEEHYRNMIFL